MIYTISNITNIPVNYINNVENNFKLDTNVKEFLDKHNLTIREFINKFSYKELNIEYTNIKDDYSIARDIIKYLEVNNLESLYEQIIK